MITEVPRPGRNEPCPCGSGRKYKQCCLGKDEAEARVAHAKAAADAPEPAPETAVTSKRAPKHQTAQPWKTATSRGVFQKVRTPRKVGGG
ncbi:MAG TPA: SEC-C metal-binding domain-containing protein [Vicinamibacterales bacterium]|nr:SEC-C metal-binding domain-containing protein [Vicinamibacterales bacterium]